MPDLRWIENMEPRLRRYLGFALQRVARMDFLRATGGSRSFPVPPV